MNRAVGQRAQGRSDLHAHGDRDVRAHGGDHRGAGERVGVRDRRGRCELHGAGRLHAQRRSGRQRQLQFRATRAAGRQGRRRDDARLQRRRARRHPLASYRLPRRR
mgnify:CR=1 FL=1